MPRISRSAPPCGSFVERRARITGRFLLIRTREHSCRRFSYLFLRFVHDFEICHRFRSKLVQYLLLGLLPMGKIVPTRSIIRGIDSRFLNFGMGMKFEAIFWFSSLIVGEKTDGRSLSVDIKDWSFFTNRRVSSRNWDRHWGELSKKLAEDSLINEYYWQNLTRVEIIEKINRKNVSVNQWKMHFSWYRVFS